MEQIRTEIKKVSLKKDLQASALSLKLRRGNSRPNKKHSRICTTKSPIPETSSV